MEQALRWGILGTGNIAHQFMGGVVSSRRCSITCVGSRQLASAQAFAGDYQIPRAFGSYDDVLRSPEVDVVYVSLPNSLHNPWTIAALRAGKHVLCEKPIASNAVQAQEMFDTARQCGRVLMEAFMYRSHPQTLAVLDLVRNGAIGELKLIRTSFCFRTRRTDGNIRFDRTLSGGALMDIGCYCTDFSRLLTGAEPMQMDVTGHLHKSGVDDLAAGTLTFPGGTVASFTCGMTLQADNTAYVCGSEAFIEIPVPWKPPQDNATFTLVRGTPPRMESLGQPSPATPPRQPHIVNAKTNLFADEADDFVATILDAKPPRITPEQSIGNMRVLDTLRRKLGVPV